MKKSWDNQNDQVLIVLGNNCFRIGGRVLEFSFNFNGLDSWQFCFKFVYLANCKRELRFQILDFYDDRKFSKQGTNAVIIIHVV